MIDHNLGGTVRLDDEGTLALLAGLYDDGAIRHIQVQAVPPLSRQFFLERLDRIAATGIPVVIHAPHHNHASTPAPRQPTTTALLR